MQPEDIIQQKEWRDLTTDEHAAVAPLAASEAEFNLLKKMLLVATEDDVPPVSDAVLVNIKTHLPAPVQKRRWMWYAAAAAAVIGLAVGLFLLVDPKQPPSVASLPTPTKQPVTGTEQPLPPVVAPTPEPKDIAAQQPATPPKANRKTPAGQSGQVAINTSVGANAPLLEFVTEVY